MSDDFQYDQWAVAVTMFKNKDDGAINVMTHLMFVMARSKAEAEGLGASDARVSNREHAIHAILSVKVPEKTTQEKYRKKVCGTCKWWGKPGDTSDSRPCSWPKPFWMPIWWGSYEAAPPNHGCPTWEENKHVR